MDALAARHDAAVHMIDTSIVRVHQHGACIADNNHQDMGRSRGGLTGCADTWRRKICDLCPGRATARTLVSAADIKPRNNRIEH
jgi:hypothetical protein